MKKRVLRSIICFLLSVVIITECNLGVMNVHATEMAEQVENLESELEEEVSEETEEIITASSYLYPFEEAVTALEELAATRELQAVVYLADIITMRTLPEEASEPVKNLLSGDVVNIIGAGQDAEYNIWYQVFYTDGTEEVTGYVRKDNVACVDQEFTKWQESYVRSIGMFGRLTRGTSYFDIEQFPQSYQSALYALKQKYPNWIFVKVTGNANGVDWTTFVQSQVGARSYIWTNGTPDSWKTGPTGETNWSYASEGIIRYYIDPRNWLSEKDVFQFEMLGYHPEFHTVEAVESILSGSFMANARIENNMTYAQAFVELGRTTDVSPFFLAARVLQEQGYQGSSPLISGKYPGYEGYYNYYNIGASGNNDVETIVNGLQKAKDKGWDSRYKALKAGIEFLLLDYIKVGQNTLYLQKFDIIGTLSTHQYMQNIKAPSQEAAMVYKAYSNKSLLNQGFIFRIPVYNNMPAKAVQKPGEEDKIALSSTQIDNLQVNSEITLNVLVNGQLTQEWNWSFTSSNPEVATVDNNGLVKALKAGETTITCKSVDDIYNPNVGTCKITVIPADIDLAKLEKPILQDIVYNPNTTLKDIELPTGYTWVNPEVVPIVAKSAYAVIYSPDAEKYNPITFELVLNVQKKALTTADYTVPSGLEGGAGRELGSVALPVGFYWNNPQEKLADTVGTKEYLAYYNLDNANYEAATDIIIKVNVICENHVFGEWEITKATCEADGTKIRKCTICASKEELVLEKTGHLYEAEITVEATEEADGIRTYTCKNCGDSYTENIPKLPSTHVHKYEETIIKKASCTEEGEKAFECSCGDKYTEIVNATGHKVENGRCQQCGYTDAVETPDTDKPSVGGNDKPADTDKPNTGEDDKPADTDKPSAGGNDKPADTDKPSTGGNDKPADTDKPSTGGNTGTTETNKPSAGGNTGTTETNKPSAGGNTGTIETNKPSAGGNTGTTETNKPNAGENSGGNNNNSNVNSGTNNNSGVSNNNSNVNSGTNNNSGASNNNSNVNSGTNNSSGTSNNNSNVNSGTNNNSGTSNSSDKNVADSNASTDNTTNSKPTTNPSTMDTVTDGNTSANDNTSTGNTQTESTQTENTQVENNEVTENNIKENQKEEEKKEENKTQSTTTSDVTQAQSTNTTNQVEIELMSELMENTKEKETHGEKQKVSIQLNKNTDISQKIVEMAKENGVDLEVNLSNELMWTIKAESLSDGMPSSVNMNAEIVQDVVEKKIIDTVASDKEYMELSLSHDGEFGFNATLTVPVEEKYAGQMANLFYFNEKTKVLEFQMAALVDDEYKIRLEFNHASDYVIVFAMESMEEVVTQVDTFDDIQTEEASKEIPTTESETKELNKLIVMCIIIMIIAGGLAGAGYFIYFNKKEVSDGQDFESWLKEEEAPKAEAEIQKEESDDYLDDDVDDYREKEEGSERMFNTGRIAVSEALSNTGRIAINREEDFDDYLDDDVDDYVEKDR